MKWKGRRVLVTGAGGFIGSHLTERLVREGARVRALVHYNALGTWGWLDHSPVRADLEVISGDICDADMVRQAVKRSDAVFHLAALIGIPYSYQAPASYVRTNVGGTLNVLQAVLEFDVEKLVHTSTSEVYGTARRVPMDEEHPLQGQSPYAATKIGADKLAEAFHLSFGLPVVTVRPFNAFGPRQSARAIVPTIITQVLTRSKVRLGHLESTRDLNFVEDTVDGFLRAAGASAAVGRVINIGSGKETSIGELARIVLDLVGKDLPVVCEKRRKRPEPSEVRRLCADNRLARELLGWRPRHTLREGLLQTIEWVEKNIDHYRPEDYSV